MTRPTHNASVSPASHRVLPLPLGYLTQLPAWDRAFLLLEGPLWVSEIQWK